MPTSARKSSLGVSNRRGPQKYIPYRADDLQHGKRTGIAVAYVEHSSDDFEPFERVISQADAKTPPKPKLQRKRKTAKTPIIEEEDEDGEMSMELDDSFANSPVVYSTHSRAATSRSSSRYISRQSDLDFDKIPSPRSDSTSYRRQSLASNFSVGPSRLSRSTVARGDEPADDFDNPNYDEVYDEEGTPRPEDESDAERTPVPSRKQSLSVRSVKSAKPPSSARSHRRFDPEDEEVDVEGEDEVEQHLTGKQSRVKGKGKQRQIEPEPEEEHEEPDEELPLEPYPEDEHNFDEPPGDQQDFDEPPPDDMEVDQEQPAPSPSPPKKTGKRRKGEDTSLEKERPNKKPKSENDGVERQKKPRGRPRKQDVLTEVIQDQNVDDDSGLRRGSRMRYKPLDWWRCEKVVYGRRESGKSLVPTIKEIRRIPQEEAKPLGGRHRRKRQARSKSITVEPDEDSFNPEEGWDDETEPKAYVLEYPGGEEVERRVAFTANMVEVKPAATADFFFQKVFGDGNFMAAGQLVLPPGGQKPTKSTKDNTFIFYVIQGAVNVRIHRTSFILSTGGMFLVPRGNMYFIRNIAKRDTKLFFAQARRNIEELVQESDRDRSPTAVESN